jgi:hypothetical protein
LQPVVPDIVDKHGRADLRAAPIEQLSVAGKADDLLLRIVGDFIRTTVPGLAGVRARMFKMRRGADGGHLGELAVAKLEDGLICPERAARLQSDHHPAGKGPPAVRETQARGTGPLGRQSCIPLRNDDIREVGSVSLVVDV